jgi:hypothetical protein
VRPALAAHRVVGEEVPPYSSPVLPGSCLTEADREGLDLDAGLTLHPYGRSFLVEFVEALVGNYEKGGYVTRERERLTDAIARAEEARSR